MLAVVDLAQIQHRALHHATARTAPAFDNAPITVLLAVLPSPRESQGHGPRNYAQSKIRKEGRSSLHAFPPHRPLIRLAFCRQNSKIRGPVGKVRLAEYRESRGKQSPENGGPSSGDPPSTQLIDALRSAAKKTGALEKT